MSSWPDLLMKLNFLRGNWRHYARAQGLCSCAADKIIKDGQAVLVIGDVLDRTIIKPHLHGAAAVISQNDIVPGC